MTGKSKNGQHGARTVVIGSPPFVAKDAFAVFPQDLTAGLQVRPFNNFGRRRGSQPQIAFG